MRLFAALFLCLLAPLFAARASVNEAVTSYTLENGMQIVVIEDHRAPVVTHMVWYRVGSADDPQGKSGIAHFLEHLMFKGTGELAPGEFSEIVQVNGGTGNAFTSWDYTAYFQQIAADRLELMMRLEADRMQHLSLTEEEFLPERDVILEERNLRVENDPSSIFNEQRRATLYLNHPYSRPIIGWRHEIEALTRADAIDFYRTYYAPNNAILVVAGSVDPEEVLELAETYYGPIEPSAALPQRVRPQEPVHLAERRVIYKDARVRRPYVIRDYLVSSRRPGAQKEAAALRVLAKLLGDGVTSHLVQTLQFEEKVAIGAGAYYSSTGVDEQDFAVYAIPAEGVTLEEVEARLDAALDGFIADGPDPEKLARARNEIRAAEIYALDNQEARARNYGTALATGLTLEDVAAWPMLLQEVTAEDVRAAAQGLLDKRRSVTGYLMGEDADE